MARMSTTPLAALALAMMLRAQPSAPWADTYPSTAKAVAEAAHASPVFAGGDGEQRTVALLVSMAWFESTFNPAAVGDNGRSVCLFQIHETNWKWLGVTREALQDVRVCARTAVRMVHQSFRVCRARPLEERLGWYAAGGPDCTRGLSPSRHRVRKALWLFAHVTSGADFLAHDP